MSGKYEIWLCDDAGRRMHLFTSEAYFSYSRTTAGLGTIQLGCPFDDYVKKIPSLFRPDWRLDVWRSPESGIPARREGSFLLRKYMVYERESDHVRIIEFFARSPLEILRRQAWKLSASITDTIDNIMKTIVSGRFVTNLTAYSTSPNTLSGVNYVSTGEFAVDGNSGDGPTITDSFYLQNVLDILNDLKNTSMTLNLISPSNKRIYFDVIEDDGLVPNGFGYRFRTYVDLRGTDRTTGTIFSTENGNLGAPAYFEDYTDQITSIFQYSANQPWASRDAQSDEQYLSRWNYIEDSQAVSTEAAAVALNNIYSQLKSRSSQKILNGDFLNSPGSETQPRSLYGLDWDLGDRLPVKFAGKSMNVDVLIVYVSVNDQGQEKISGKSSVGV